MNYLPLLTEDEVSYICSIIPHHDTIEYFKHNPKEFARIRPGFRAISISKEEANVLLFRYHNRNFISSFVEKHISKWISQIQEYFAKCIDDGERKDIALIHTLSFCVFNDNIQLYFKLVNEDCSEEYISLMSATIKAVNEVSKKQDELKEERKALENVCKKLQTELDKKDFELSKNKKGLSISLLEISELKDKVSILGKLQFESKKDSELIQALQTNKTKLLEKIDKLTTEITEVKDNSLLLEEQIRGEVEKQQKSLHETQFFTTSPKCPSDMDEFKEFIGYNFISIGIPNDVEYFPLLLSYISKIVFQGVPILVNRETGPNVIKCIANTIVGKTTIKTLLFSQDMTVEKINQFLSLPDERIVCLDNFIGHFNETELIPIIENHKDKIVFLTVAYDKTLNYVAREFLRYCHYLNVNRIMALSVNTNLTEDPTSIEEIEHHPKWSTTENRYSNILKSILQDLKYPQSMIERKCANIFDEQSLCETLCFDILPYFADVLQVNPYNISEQLISYAGPIGRCPKKELFLKWFA